MPKPTLSVCVIWFIFCAISFSDAGFNLFAFYAAVLFGLIWMLVWLIRISLHWFKKYKDPNARRQHSIGYWTIEPLVLIITVALAWSGAFSYTRFFASLPALNQYAGQVRSGQIDLAFEFKHPPRYIGLYRMTMTELLADGTVRFITSSHNLFDEAGFAHSPNHPPLAVGEDTYRPIDGPWWYWQQSW